MQLSQLDNRVSNELPFSTLFISKFKINHFQDILNNNQQLMQFIWRHSEPFFPVYSWKSVYHRLLELDKNNSLKCEFWNIKLLIPRGLKNWLENLIIGWHATPCDISNINISWSSEWISSQTSPLPSATYEVTNSTCVYGTWHTKVEILFTGQLNWRAELVTPHIYICAYIFR